MVKNCTHRGVIGIESAVVMISAVVVASALVFVLFSAGVSTAQKTQTTTGSALADVRTNLSIDGMIVGIASVQEDMLNATAIPLRMAIAGGTSINLDPNITAVRLATSSVEHGSIQLHVFALGTYSDLDDVMQKAMSEGLLSKNPILETAATESTQAILFFIKNNNDNFILDSAEHAFLVIIFQDSERPRSLDRIKIEVILASGSSLTVERAIPNITKTFVNLE